MDGALSSARRPYAQVGSGGTLLVYCHAGCSQGAVIAALRDRQVWGAAASLAAAGSLRQAPQRDILLLSQRRDRALRLWGASQPATGTRVEVYLRSRGLKLAPPGALRFSPHLHHRSGGFWPAMIALIVDGASGRPIGAHRTYLGRDGRGKAPIEPNKMMLGPCRGGAVRLAPACDPLMIGEGIETCLAAMQATGHGAWAALSTSGLRALDLPALVRDVIVLADGDAPGEAAALAAAARWWHEGRRVRIARSPQGADFNDMLLDRSTSSGERAR